MRKVLPMALKDWFTDEAKFRIVRILISGIALIISLGKFAELPYGIDFAWIAVILCGVPIVWGAAKALVTEHDIKADLMVSLALIGSLIAEEYFAAGEVAFIMEIGSALEDYSAARARKGIEKLINLRPKTARVKRDGKEIVVPVEEVRVGDRLVVLAGETIPVDGTVVSGETSIDQSVMTGESLPVDKGPGDSVISGTVNRFGVFEYDATSEEKDSSLQRMIDLAKEADENKAPIVRQADRWATWLVIFALAASLCTYIGTALILGDTGEAFDRAVTVLVVICPCAFVLATPTAIIAGIGNATGHGLIVKSGDAMQRFGYIDTVAFDKTGTLTHGDLRVTACESFDPEYPDDEILKLAAAAESRSEHPIGKAISSAFEETGRKLPEIDRFEVSAGSGVSAVCGGVPVLVGKEKFLRENGIEVDGSRAQKYLSKGATAVFVAANGKAVGLVALADTVRATAAPTASRLRSMGVNTVLLTGDNPAAAAEIASEAGVSEVRAELMPEDKQRIIRDYQSEGHKVCMIGDGINDALALTSADAAIAMGGIGSDIAIESSDAVLVSDDISRVPYLIYLSRKVLNKITVNIAISLTINVIATILAATGVLDAVVGALVHNAGSVFVVVNSLFLLRVKDPAEEERKGKSPGRSVPEAAGAAS
jgi:heavy metal translocating P-type ATPase